MTSSISSTKKSIPVVSKAVASIASALPSRIVESVWYPPSARCGESPLLNAVRNNGFIRHRALRSDKYGNLQSILIWMIKHFDVGSGAIVVKRCGFFRAATVNDIALSVNLTCRTVWRCLHMLKDIGFVEAEEQTIQRLNVNGTYIFNATIKKLTDYFWETIGLSVLLHLERMKRIRQFGQHYISRPQVSKKIQDGGKVGNSPKTSTAGSQGPSRLDFRSMFGEKKSSSASPSSPSPSPDSGFSFYSMIPADVRARLEAAKKKSE